MKAKIIRAALFSAAIVGAGFSASAFADMQVFNWQLVNGPVNITGINALDFNGESYITVNPTSATTFTFTDVGLANITTINGGQPTGLPGTLGFTFSATGSGTFGGSFTFNNGGLTNFYYASSGLYPTNLAGGTFLGGFITTFTGDSSTSGGAGLDINAVPTNNTHVTVTHNPPSNINGINLAPLPASPSNTWLDQNSVALDPWKTAGFITTNASLDNSFNPGSTLSAYQINMETALGLTPNVYNTTSSFFVTNGGQFKLSTVPVPGTLLLMGLGLTVLGYTLSRNARNVA